MMHRGSYDLLWGELFILSFSLSTPASLHFLRIIKKHKKEIKGSRGAEGALKVSYDSRWIRSVFQVLMTPIIHRSTPFYHDLLQVHPNTEMRQLTEELIKQWLNMVFSHVGKILGKRRTDQTMSIRQLREKWARSKKEITRGDLENFLDQVIASQQLKSFSLNFKVNWFGALIWELAEPIKIRMIRHMLSGYAQFENVSEQALANESTTWETLEIYDKVAYIMAIVGFFISVYSSDALPADAILIQANVSPWFKLKEVFEFLLQRKLIKPYELLFSTGKPRSFFMQAMLESVLNHSDDVIHCVSLIKDESVYGSFMSHFFEDLTDEEKGQMLDVLSYADLQGELHLFGNILKHRRNGVAFCEPGDMDVVVLTREKSFFYVFPEAWKPYRTKGLGSPISKEGRFIRQYCLKVAGWGIDVNVHLVPNGIAFESYLGGILYQYTKNNMARRECLQFLRYADVKDIPKKESSATLMCYGIGPHTAISYYFMQRLMFYEMDMRKVVLPELTDSGIFRSWVKVVISHMKSVFAWCQHHQDCFQKLVFPALKHFFDLFEDQVSHCDHGLVIDSDIFVPTDSPWMQLAKPLQLAQAYVILLKAWINRPVVSMHLRALLLCFIQSQAAPIGTKKGGVFDRRLNVFNGMMHSYVNQLSVSASQAVI